MAGYASNQSGFGNARPYVESFWMLFKGDYIGGGKLREGARAARRVIAESRGIIGDENAGKNEDR